MTVYANGNFTYTPNTSYSGFDYFYCNMGDSLTTSNWATVTITVPLLAGVSMCNSFAGRRAFTLIELLVVVALIAILVALLVPAVQKARYAAAKTQSANNLKRCALASHAYHDAWKYLPYNGTASATNSDNSSGSWAFQILPYADQQALYNSQPANVTIGDPVPILLCAIRSRPGYYTGSTSGAVTGTIVSRPLNSNGATPTLVATFTANPTFTFAFPAVGAPGISYTVSNVSGPVNVTLVSPQFGTVAESTISDSPPGQAATFNLGGTTPGSIVITSTAPGSSSSGPATDFGVNVFLNDPNSGINSPNVYRQLGTITDGTSNTILMGHAYVQTSVYSSTTPMPPSLQAIFIGGSLATGRNTLGNTPATWLQDGTATTANQWGSPMPEGGLMAMCDGTVRIFPYATVLADFLLPDDGNPVELP